MKNHPNKINNNKSQLEKKGDMLVGTEYQQTKLNPTHWHFKSTTEIYSRFADCGERKKNKMCPSIFNVSQRSIQLALVWFKIRIENQSKQQDHEWLLHPQMTRTMLVDRISTVILAVVLQFHFPVARKQKSCNDVGQKIQVGQVRCILN